MFINGQIDKWIAVEPYDWRLCHNKKEQTPTAHNMDESQEDLSKRHQTVYATRFYLYEIQELTKQIHDIRSQNSSCL